MRTCITGGPRTGKTTRAVELARERGVIAQHTDDVIARFAREKDGWSLASAEVATWFRPEGPWIIEGVAVARALRKWMAANADGAPCDEVLLLERPLVALTLGQSAMGKGVATVWREILPVLLVRGVIVRKE